MTTLYLSSESTVEMLFDAANAVLGSISALTDAVLISIRVKYKSAPYDPVSVSGSPITDTGVFFFTTGPSTPDDAIVIHAIDSAILKTDGPTAGYGIDLENSDVIAFANAVLSLPFSNRFGDAFDALFAAYKQSRV